jgi:ParB family chromosome partitioning protein
VRETERLVQQPATKTTAKSARQVDPDILHLEKELADKLGAAVTIEHKGSKGKLVVQYYSLEELEGVLQRIR